MIQGVGFLGSGIRLFHPALTSLRSFVRPAGRGHPPTLGSAPGPCRAAAPMKLSHACTQHAWRYQSPPCAAAGRQSSGQRAASRRAHRLRARSPNIARVRANGWAAYVPRFCSLPRLSPSAHLTAHGRARSALRRAATMHAWLAACLRLRACMHSRMCDPSFQLASGMAGRRCRCSRIVVC
jgi:hypothetical protein